MQKRNKIYKTWYTHKQSVDIKLFGISRTQNDNSNKKKQKGEHYKKERNSKGTLNLSVDKIYSVVTSRIWVFSLSFMFSLPKRSV